MRSLVTSVRVEIVGGHDVVHVWTRGGKAGTLIVSIGDGHLLAKRLMGYKDKDVESAPVAGPKPMGYCHKCREPVVLGDETWGYMDARGDWNLSLDGYLHHKGCTGE